MRRGGERQRGREGEGPRRLSAWGPQGVNPVLVFLLDHTHCFGFKLDKFRVKILFSIAGFFVIR